MVDAEQDEQEEVSDDSDESDGRREDEEREPRVPSCVAQSSCSCGEHDPVCAHDEDSPQQQNDEKCGGYFGGGCSYIEGIEELGCSGEEGGDSEDHGDDDQHGGDGENPEHDAPVLPLGSAPLEGGECHGFLRCPRKFPVRGCRGFFCLGLFFGGEAPEGDPCGEVDDGDEDEGREPRVPPCVAQSSCGYGEVDPD